MPYRNTVYNLIGNLSPLLISLFTVPLYLHIVGDIRYGILAIAWLFVGYFGVFDLGMSRATAFYMAKLDGATQRERASVFWTAVGVNAFFGIVGGILVFVAAQYAFTDLFGVAPEMRPEVAASLPWLAASLPVATVGGVLGGTLQGRERFAAVNTIGVLNVALTQIVPLGVAMIERHRVVRNSLKT